MLRHRSAMRLTCTIESELPPLAYCVRVRGTSADLVHGHMVTTGDRFFHDGAWAGDFDDPAFDRVYSCGTGGYVSDDSLRLATPEMPIECLYLSVEGDAMYASNSLAFLLEILDDSLDVEHLRYRDDMLSVEWGVRLSKVSIPTAGQRRIRVLLGEVADITGGRVSISHRRVARAFNSWEDYIATLRQTMEALVTNAADQRRDHTYEPLVAMSTGYDSTAVAALAAPVGVTDGITMLRYAPDGTPVDHPGEIASKLSIELLEVPRDTWRDRTDIPEASLAASLTTMGSVSLLALDEHLPGRLFLTGVSGDNVWDINNRRYARDVVHGYGHLGGRSLVEHRLQLGYVRCSPAEICHSAHPSIHAITVSSDLRPWSVEGSYDRPIARRIAEEAGVRRTAFGVSKYAASARVGNSRTYSAATERSEMEAHLLEIMSPAATESFLDYLDAIDTDGFRRRMAIGRIWNRVYTKLDALDHRASHSLRRLGIRRVIPRRAMRRLATHGATDYDYTRWLPHWGVEHVKPLYSPARTVLAHTVLGMDQTTAAPE